jgi:hypothetical protein
MSDNGKAGFNEDQIVTEVISTQLAHFRSIRPPCRGMELPDGILLRHALSASLYFYLRTSVENGKISTRVFASDSPYDQQKAGIGSVVTPMFEPEADRIHLEKLEKLIRQWVDFVGDQLDQEHDFRSFKIDP